MLQQSLKAKLSQKMEEGAVGVKGEEYTAVFLGHTLTPPLVEATIMASVSDKLVFQSQVFLRQTKATEIFEPHSSVFNSTFQPSLKFL